MNRIQPNAQENAKAQNSQEPHVVRQQVRYAAAAKAQAALIRQYPAMLAHQATQSAVAPQSTNDYYGVISDDSQTA